MVKIKVETTPKVPKNPFVTSFIWFAQNAYAPGSSMDFEDVDVDGRRMAIHVKVADAVHVPKGSRLLFFSNGEDKPLRVYFQLKPFEHHRGRVDSSAIWLKAAA